MSIAIQTEAADIQALVRTGFGSLNAARYILLRINDAAETKAWLRELQITSAAQAIDGQLDKVVQIAFTAAGLLALGINLEVAEDFAPEFLNGMACEGQHPQRLGDEGINAPENWDWGCGNKEPHILLTILADSDEIEAIESEIKRAAVDAGCDLIKSLASSDMARREPFGFADGISQPKLDWDGQVQPGGAKDRNYRNSLAAGEVLLGHDNEYGFQTSYPKKAELGRNGTYLVFRQLSQNVTGFWQWIAKNAGKQGTLELAEKMVGRKIDGEPLPGLTSDGATSFNDFDFGSDRQGLACPIGSHIRRANPRSGDDPQGRRGFFKDVISSLGLSGTALEDAVASSRFHRILRRGRPYGKTLTPEMAMQPDAPQVDAGLHFICLNANLARQFEFVQGAWAASAKFAGLTGEQDPLLGNRLPFPRNSLTDGFTYHDANRLPRRKQSLPQFVTVKGGAYFFMPGLNGLKKILG